MNRYGWSITPSRISRSAVSRMPPRGMLTIWSSASGPARSKRCLPMTKATPPQTAIRKNSVRNILPTMTNGLRDRREEDRNNDGIGTFSGCAAARGLRAEIGRGSISRPIERCHHQRRIGIACSRHRAPRVGRQRRRGRLRRGLRPRRGNMRRLSLRGSTWRLWRLHGRLDRRCPRGRSRAVNRDPRRARRSRLLLLLRGPRLGRRRARLDRGSRRGGSGLCLRPDLRRGNLPVRARCCLGSGLGRDLRRRLRLRRPPPRRGQRVARRGTCRLRSRLRPARNRLAWRLWPKRRGVRHRRLRRAGRRCRTLRRLAPRPLSRRLGRRLTAAAVAAGRLIGRAHRRSPHIMRVGLPRAE